MRKNSKIYLAGHTGLVGSALKRNLESKGYANVIGRTIDELDLTNQQDVADFFKAEKPEYVLLAAAKVGGIVANNTYRGQFIYENLMIQNNVVHQSYLNGVKKLLFLGSSCIYPKQSPQPLKEKYLLTDVLEYTNEPYAIAKIAGIKLCESYNIQYGTNFICVMPTNLYGPNDNYDLEKSHVLPALIRKMHLGKCLIEDHWDAIRHDFNKKPVEGVDGNSTQIEIAEKLEKYGIFRHALSGAPVTVRLWGTGAPRREFLHSDDMADACVFLMENIDFKDIVKDKFADRITSRDPKIEIRNTHINVGTGRDLTIKELAHVIKETVGFDGLIEWDTSKPDGTPQKLLSVKKLHELGWKEKIGFEEGIKKVYEQYIA
ncbi:MAG: rmlD substrate binding domain protein [Bacteroidetes bacterium]|nr:rmlD substrate binding domain protein [Bacteroidota bacterium]MBS1234237.1 rmlD substrate binding domain protein [Bacteroidota bacterium]